MRLDDFRQWLAKIPDTCIYEDSDGLAVVSEEKPGENSRLFDKDKGNLMSAAKEATDLPKDEASSATKTSEEERKIVMQNMAQLWLQQEVRNFRLL